nr:hypothetical protein [Tanacetum cinerariifolium]
MGRALMLLMQMKTLPGQNENFVEEVVDDAQVSTATKTFTITTKKITLAHALEALKTSKPKAKINADHQFVKRMQAKEQEELSDAEKATLFQQLLEKRRKHFATKRAEEKRNKPPTKAPQRKIICTYLKNMEGYKLKDLKLKEFDSIQEMFDRAFKRVNTFEDFRTELVKGKEKRVGEELVQKITKKQKVEDDKEKAELKYQMLKSFDREDLEDLYKLVKARYGSTRPVENIDYLLWSDMKIMFEPHVEDEIYMLVEKKYPLIPPIVFMMLEKKLQIDYESKMAYQLCKLIKKQLKNLRSVWKHSPNDELGKYALWSVMTREMRKEVLDNTSTRWNGLVAESKSKGTQSADNNMSSEVSPNEPIVQTVDIHEKPSSNLGTTGGSKPKPRKSKENFHSLFSNNLCDVATLSFPKKGC